MATPLLLITDSLIGDLSDELGGLIEENAEPLLLS
jgi:hypothetical protein